MIHNELSSTEATGPRAFIKHSLWPCMMHGKCAKYDDDTRLAIVASRLFRLEFQVGRQTAYLIQDEDQRILAYLSCRMRS
jgi:hypothetical protein